MDIIEKLTQITTIIKEIESEDPGLAAILMEGYGLSLNLAKEISERGSRGPIDISEHLEVVGRVLGVDIKELVTHIMQTQDQGQTSDKEPDADTLEFITNDLDDYEKFLAQNKAKESLDFLSKEI
jgi:hypothetical protein